MNAASVSVAVGDRTVKLNVPSACKLQGAKNTIAQCSFPTKRNQAGGNYDEETTITIAGGPVSVRKVLNSKDVVDVNKASQIYMRNTQHKYLKKIGASRIEDEEYDINPLVVSKKEPWGGRDCIIFSIVDFTKKSETNKKLEERISLRCLLWTYGSDKGVAVSDILVEIRLTDDYYGRSARGFERAGGRLVRSVKFK